jgi:hypothetical protein
MESSYIWLVQEVLLQKTYIVYWRPREKQRMLLLKNLYVEFS